jgi:PPOX class probable F420-dependent enzyme
MRSFHLIPGVALAASLFFSALAHGEQTMETSPMKKHSVHSSRQILETKTFPPAVVDFLRQPIASQLVTINPSGSPQVTIMWFRYENGALLFTTTTDRVKFRNMQKDPRAVLTVLDPSNMYKWVVIHGKLSIDARDPAAFYTGLAEHYLTGDALEGWKKTAVMDKRTVLKLTPTRIRAMGFSQE